MTTRRLWIVGLLGILITLVTTVSAFAQTGRPTGATEGYVEGNTYHLSEAGYTFDLPQSWVANGYKWYEYWGADADVQFRRSGYVTEWVYTPRTAGNAEGTLLTLLVYTKAGWQNAVNEGPPANEVIFEDATRVYVARYPQFNPYTAGSADAQRYDSLLLSSAQVRAAFHVTNATTPAPTVTVSPTAPTTPQTPTSAAGFIAPDQWCTFAGTGATITVGGERANFTCNDDSVLVGDVTVSDEWTIEKVARTGGTPETVQVTHIWLSDGTDCAWAGRGATTGYGDKRVNFTCAPQGSTLSLAGDITIEDDGWHIEQANVEIGANGPAATNIKSALIAAIGVETIATPTPTTPATPVSAEGFIAPDNWCEFAGTGATVTVGGERANFTCDDDSVLIGEVTVGDEWTIAKATVSGTQTTETVQVTHIWLSDGTDCAWAGSGATTGYDDKRVNFTCAPQDGTLTLAGDITLEDDGWHIEQANVVIGANGPEASNIKSVLIAALGVESMNTP